MVAMQILILNLAVLYFGFDRAALQAGNDPPLSLTALVSGSYLLTLVLSVFWIISRYQVDLAHVGFSSRKLGRNLMIGVIGGVTILPVVFALSAVVNLGFDTQYDHPILDTMREEGTLSSYLLALFSAAIVAPLAEEYLFRVVIQGWLQSVPFSALGSNILGASGAQRSDPANVLYYHPFSGANPAVLTEPGNRLGIEPESLSSTSESNAEQFRLGQDHSTEVREQPDQREENPFEPPGRLSDASRHALADSQQALPQNAGTVPPPIWPSIVTGILFGLAHWGYGLSFIPLIVFGIFLGLLYRATQSIWPCVIVHLMLNASSMIMLGLAVLVSDASAN